MSRQSSVVKIKMELSLGEVILAIKDLPPEDKEFFIENLLAAVNPEYLDSIKQAREDYQAGRTITHDELFNQRS